jgi:hypothetical protein
MAKNNDTKNNDNYNNNGNNCNDNKGDNCDNSPSMLPKHVLDVTESFLNPYNASDVFVYSYGKKITEIICTILTYFDKISKDLLFLLNKKKVGFFEKQKIEIFEKNGGFKNGVLEGEDLWEIMKLKVTYFYVIFLCVYVLIHIY